MEAAASHPKNIIYPFLNKKQIDNDTPNISSISKECHPTTAVEN